MRKSFLPYDGEVDGLWGGIARESKQAWNIMQEHFIPRPMNGLPFEMRIKPGVYFLRSCLSEDKSPSPMEMSFVQDEMIENKHKYVIRSEIASFFKKRDLFESEGLIHKRGLILYGPPSSGKTSIIREEIQLAADNGAIVFMARSPYVLTDSMQVFRTMEPDRDLIVVMEDIDEIVRSWGEQELLEMMDGMNSVNHVLFIASTNHPECMSAKLRRPGRFDRKVKIPNPDFNQRKQYFAMKYENRLSEDRIESLAYHTDGFGFGQMREVFISHKGYGRPLSESVKYVKKDMLVEQKSDKQTRLRGRRDVKALVEDYG
jgi:SpoVK/Ycf46/Vps4 family AAA+-type ATPase